MSERTDELEHLLRDVGRSFFGLMHDATERFQLPPGAKPVIHSILTEPGVTVSEISRKAGVSKSHVSKIVEALSGKGLLEKRPDPSDQRLTRIYLTKQAEDNFRAIRDERRRRLSEVAAGMPPGKLDEVIEGLRTLKDSLDAYSARNANGEGGGQQDK